MKALIIFLFILQSEKQHIEKIDVERLNKYYNYCNDNNKTKLADRLENIYEINFN